MLALAIASIRSSTKQRTDSSAIVFLAIANLSCILKPVPEVADQEIALLPYRRLLATSPILRLRHLFLRWLA